MNPKSLQLRVAMLGLVAVAAATARGQNRSAAAYTPEFLKYVGGSANNGSRGIARDGSGNIYVIGVTQSNDLARVGNQIAIRPTDAEWPSFIQKYDSAGTLLYSSYIGPCNPSAITVDDSGFVYIVGTYSSPHTCVTPGAFQTGDTAHGEFVMKLDLHAGSVIFGAHLGMTDHWDPMTGANVRAVRLDGSRNVYIGGTTYSSDFPTTGGAFQAKFLESGVSNHHGFVAKLDSSGRSLIYSTLLEGNKDEDVADIQIDADENTIITGSTRSTDFPVTDRAFQTKNTAAFANCTNAFVTTLDKTGSRVLYSTYLGGSWSTGTSLAIRGNGEIAVTGSTYYDDFTTTANAYQRKYRGKLGNVFVVDLDTTSGKLKFSTLIGSRGDDTADSLAIGPAGRLIVVGETNSGSFPVTKHSYQSSWGSFNVFEAFFGDNIPTDGFISVLRGDGSALLYSTFVGGSENDSCDGVVVDDAGNIFVSGGTESSSLPAAQNGKQEKNKHTGAGFLIKLRPAAS